MASSLAGEARLGACSSALLGFQGSQGGVEGTPLSESFFDVAPIGADAVAVSGKEIPTSIDSALARAVTSSGGPIQVLLILFTQLLNHRLTPDSLHH